MPITSRIVGSHTITPEMAHFHRMDGPVVSFSSRNGSPPSANSTTERRISFPNGAASLQSTSGERNSYEVYTSKPVREVKTLLWEIKDFQTVLSEWVYGAMNFEFEVGRLGSIERHLPRRSRWKVSFDSSYKNGYGCKKPALKVQLLSPGDRTIFYRMQACVMIMHSADSTEETETEIKTNNYEFKEGQTDLKSTKNLHPLVADTDQEEKHNHFIPLKYIINGSVFIKVKFEVLEDASSQ